MKKPDHEEIAVESKIFNRLWAILKKYYHINDQEDEWQAVIDELVAFYNEFEAPLARSMAMAVLDHLEGIVKNRNNEWSDEDE